MREVETTPPGKPAMKEIIDEHLHREGFSPEWLTVEVEDRVAEGGVREVGGGEILGVHGGFIDLRDGSRVPLHRVHGAHSRGRVVFEAPHRG